MEKVLFNGESELKVSDEWSDDLWFIDQENRNFIKNDGWWILQDGNAKGTIKGGNLGTFLLLSGTPYQPTFNDDTILMLEDCFSSETIDGKYFMRQLQSLAQRDDFKKVKALVFGRFQKASKVSREFLQSMVASIPQLRDIPIIANTDFGHTTPIATLPIGGICEINNAKIKVWW